MILAILIVLRDAFATGVPTEPVGSLSIVIALLAVDFGNLLPASLPPTAYYMW